MSVRAYPEAALTNENALPTAGYCDPRFSRVNEEFIENFKQRGERGGAVAVWCGGRQVVDIWGGWSDVARQAAWQRDTIVNFFSVSKALCAIAAARLVDRGKLDLDSPVERYWPEFAQADKEQITVRQLLSHQAGLPAIREPLPDGAAMNWNVIIRALEAQPPWWKPGTAHGYHVNTFGFLAGEFVRRISGRTVGTFLREEVTEPLTADVHIGLPASEHHGVAEFLWPGNPLKPEIDRDEALMRWNAYWNPPGFSGSHWVNTANGVSLKFLRRMDTEMPAASRGYMLRSQMAARSTASASLARTLSRRSPPNR